MGIRRAVVGALGALVVIGALLPGTVGAASKTRWVDDDGKVGRTSCDGTRKASKTIQAAVTASGIGDTILVCPGVYVEEIVITGDGRELLTLRSVTPGKAIIRSVTTGATRTLVTIDADAVTLQGFKLQARTVAPCVHLQTMVSVTGAGAQLTGNTIAPLGVVTLGGCGYSVGVQATGQGTVRLDSNTIVDFQAIGIIALNGEARVRSYRDKVRFLHASPDHGDQPFINAYGIYAAQGGTARVVGTTIESRPRGSEDYRLTVDIKMVAVTGGRVINTTLTKGDLGILLATTSNVTIRGTTVTGAKQGIVASNATGNTITGSTIRGTEESIHLESTATGNSVSDADANGDGTFDCIDDTESGGPVSNTWSNVAGVGSPPSICNP